MPKMSLTSEDRKFPIIPENTDCLAEVESVEVRSRSTKNGPVQTATLKWKLISDKSFTDPEDGTVHNLNGLYLFDELWLTDAAAWRVEAACIGVDAPYQKSFPDPSNEKKFRIDFDTDDFVKRRAILQIKTEQYQSVKHNKMMSKNVVGNYARATP